MVAMETRLVAAVAVRVAAVVRQAEAVVVMRLAAAVGGG